MPNAPTVDFPVPAGGLKAKALRPARIVLRKLLQPFIARQSEVIDALTAEARAGAVERDHLRQADAALHSKIDCVSGTNDARSDKLNDKLDRLNDKLDRINEKFEGLLKNFDALADRQSGIERDFAAVVALHWDHEAVARRLAQLEDRMIGLGDDRTEPDSDAPSIRFPGLDHYAPGPRPEAAES